MMINVLLVEDYEVNQFIAVKTLKRHGIGAMVAWLVWKQRRSLPANLSRTIIEERD
jgi:hypothetical protein